jgi:hypothetical protein
MVKHHSMKAYGGVEAYLYKHMILALDGVVCLHPTGAFPSGEEGPPITIWQVADWLREPVWRIFCPCRSSVPHPDHCTNWAIRAAKYGQCCSQKWGSCSDAGQLGNSDFWWGCLADRVQDFIVATGMVLMREGIWRCVTERERPTYRLRIVCIVHMACVKWSYI